MSELSWRFLALSWAALANALLAGLVWWRYGRQRLMRLFALSVAGLSCYSLFCAGLAGWATQEQAVAWVRASAILPYLTMISFFQLASVLARSEGVWTRRILRVSWIIAVADSLARLSGLAYINLFHDPTQGWFPGPDVVYFFLYLPTMLTLIPGGLYLLWRRRRHAASLRERVQLGYVFLAMAGALALSMFNLFPGWTPLAAVGPVLYTSVLTFAILQRRLLDIRLFLQRGAVGAALTVALGFTAVAAILLGRLAWPHGRYGDIFAAFLAATLFSLSYQALQRWIQRWAERLGSSRPWEASARLLEFSLLSGLYPGRQELLQATGDKLLHDFNVARVALVVPDHRGLLVDGIQAPQPALQPLDLPGPGVIKRLSEASSGLDLDDLAWTRQYEEQGSAQAQDELEDAEVRAFLSLNSAQCAFVLRGDQRPQGVLLIGPLRSGRPFSEQEMGFFSALAAQLGRMVEHYQLHGRVQQADRLSSLGTLAASLSHEIRNPLTSIGLMLSMLPTRHLDNDFIERFTRIVGQELERLTQLSGQMLNFAKPSGNAKAPLDLGRLAERTRQLMGYHFAKRQVRLSVRAEAQLLVHGSEAELSQVMVNLVLNALDASEPEQEVLIQILRDGDQALLQVHDQGKGISPELKAQLFDPFFTTKEHGTGLGLSTCLRIVESAGGSIEVYSAPSRGSIFEVRLPLVLAPTP